MSETAQLYRELRDERRIDGQNRRDRALRDFPGVRDAAARVGIELRQRSIQHYQFWLPSGAMLNFYPGNQRLWRDQNRPDAPYLCLPDGQDEWTLGLILEALRRSL